MPTTFQSAHRGLAGAPIGSASRARHGMGRSLAVSVRAEKVVGIDLGTTNSAVAAMEGGKPTIITNAEGGRTTPSVVAFTKTGDRLVGQIAKRQAVVNPENTFFSVKRFIGRRMTEVGSESKQVPYQVIEDGGNVKIKCPNAQKDFAPEEISAQVLRKLTADAAKFLNDKVEKAVITVPAYFNDSQRQATKDAGRIAGLEVLRIINEPTAASLAYGFDKKANETILVFDLGGGTFDVSVLEVGDGVFEVLSTSGDTHLGGDDFDKRIVDFLADEFRRTEGIELRKDRQALQRLTEAAEKAKIELSSLTQTSINLPFITATADGPKHIDTQLSRAKFEEMCSDLLDRCKVPVQQALRDAKLNISDIQEVILVGGSTRIPAVQDIVRKLSGGKDPNVSVNPDEVVALGAAVQAGVLAGEVSDIVLLDVTPLSLGLETLGGVMTRLIPRNTTLPTSKSEVFSTAADGQTSVEINVLQGEREFARDNKSLGTFRLDGIPPAPRGVPQIEVKFDIDANGILSVTATDKGTGKKQDIRITGASTLDKTDVERMVKEAERFAAEDKKRRESVETKNQAETMLYQTEKQLKEFEDKVPADVKSKVEAKMAELRTALASDDTEAIKAAMNQLQQDMMAMGQAMYSQAGAGAGAAGQQGPGASPGGSSGNPDDVIDAEFTDKK
uniref:Heat shock protein 70B n=2 Tax=Gonium pectorale TaxID=33097 RepID=A0A140JWU5_GONPE|nr:heat shock protein 70B [Gonium pectorale]